MFIGENKSLFADTRNEAFLYWKGKSSYYRKGSGTLLKVQDFGKYPKDELKVLLKELKQSVQKRIKVTSKMGRDRAHGQRQKLSRI